MIINGENMLLGRLGSFVAKRVLEGEKVIVVNSEKIIVSGNPNDVLGKYVKKIHLGSPRWGPFVPRHPYLFVKKSFRGMLPYKTKRGKEAYSRIQCFNKIPKEYEGKEFTIVPGIKSNVNKSVTIEQICKMIGAKK